MKKRILLLITLFICISSLFAEAYILPFNSSNLDLASALYPERSGKLEHDHSFNPTTYEEAKGSTYGNMHIIAYAGITLPYNWLGGNSGDMSVSISSSTNYEFISETNSAYSRPYKIYVVPSYSMNKLSVTRENVIEFSATKSNASFHYRRANYVWLDIIISLPGNTNEIYDGNKFINNGQLNLGEYRYTLSQSNDYSSLITISISAEGQSATLTIPLSGFYSESKRFDASVSMHVNRSPNAVNVDLKNQQGEEIKIADINFLYARGTTQKDLNNIDRNDTVPVIFLSSTSDPYSSGDEFRFIHESVLNSGDSFISPINSLKYVAKIRDGNGSLVASYTGKEYAVPSPGAGNTYQVNLNSPEGNATPIKMDTVIEKTALHTGDNDNYAWSSFDGEIDIELDTNPYENMVEGRYESTIYVHVMIEGLEPKSN